MQYPCLFGGAKRYIFHFRIGRETFLEYRTAPRYRCSIIARLKFLAVCLRRDCSAPREFIEGQPARCTDIYNYICPESGAGASLSSRGLLLPKARPGREKRNERTSRRVTHSPCFTRESGGKQLCSARTRTLSKTK